MATQRQPFTKSECTEENKCELPSANGSIEHFCKDRVFGSRQKPLPFRTTKLKQFRFDLHKPHSDNPCWLNRSMQHPSLTPGATISAVPPPTMRWWYSLAARKRARRCQTLAGESPEPTPTESAWTNFRRQFPQA